MYVFQSVLIAQRMKINQPMPVSWERHCNPLVCQYCLCQEKKKITHKKVEKLDSLSRGIFLKKSYV